MARSVALAAQERWFVPDIDGNREDPSPFRVKVRPLSAAQKRAIELHHLDKLGPGFLERAYEVNKAIFTDHVVAVEGYEVRAGDKVLAPKTGSELWDAIMAGPSSELALVSQVIDGVNEVSSATEEQLGK